MALKEDIKDIMLKYKELIEKVQIQLAKTLTTHRKLVTKLKKTYKNKLGSAKCEEVCKQEYIPEMEKIFDKFAKDLGLPIPKYNLVKDKFRHGALNGCKCAVCNENCTMPQMITFTPPTTTTRTFTRTSKRSRN